MEIIKNTNTGMPQKKILIHACSIAFRFFVNVVLYKTEGF